MKKGWGPRISPIRAMLLERAPGFWQAVEKVTAFLGPKFDPTASRIKHIFQDRFTRK